MNTPYYVKCIKAGNSLTLGKEYTVIEDDYSSPFIILAADDNRHRSSPPKWYRTRFERVPELGLLDVDEVVRALDVMEKHNIVRARTGNYAIEGTELVDNYATRAQLMAYFNPSPQQKVLHKLEQEKRDLTERIAEYKEKWNV